MYGTPSLYPTEWYGHIVINELPLGFLQEDKVHIKQYTK